MKYTSIFNTLTVKEKPMQKSLALLFVCLFCVLVPHFSAEASTLNKPGNNLGLVGYWAFEDGTSTVATDYSGRGNHGTLINFVPPSTSTSGWGNGKVNRGLNFDGDDRVSLGSKSSFAFGTSSFTISGWYKLSATSPTSIIMSAGGSNNGNGGVIASDPSLGLIYYAFGNQIVENSAPQTGVWTHFALVGNGGVDGSRNIKMFKNGIQVGGTVTANYNWPQQVWSIGANDSAYNEAIRGTMDEIRVYNRELSPTQITAIYDLGAQRLRPGTSNNGLVGYWSFNEGTSTTAGDFSGIGNTATLTNMATPPTVTSGWGIGKFGRALNFDGINDYVNAGNVTGIDGASGITYSAWVYRTGGTRYDGIISKFDGFNSIDMLLAGEIAGMDDIFLRVSNSPSSGYAYTTNNVLTPNVWNHVVMVFDGTQTGNSNRLKLYINNVQQSLTFIGSVGTVAPTVSSNVNIGFYNSTVNYFVGKIDEPRIYNRSLSAVEVSSLYRSGAQKVNASQNQTSSSLDTGLVGMWSFNGADVNGTTASDRSGSGNNGTLTNGPVAVIGKVGQGLRFDGLDDYVSVSTAPVLSNKPMSVSFWFKGDVSPTNYDGIMGKTTNAGWSDGWGFYFLGSNLYYFIENYAANTAYSPISNPREWNHVVGTWDGTNIKIYINGVSGTADTYTGSMTTTPNFAIGRLGTDQFNFKGSIDETRVYNRALTAAEVKLLYNMGN